MKKIGIFLLLILLLCTVSACKANQPNEPDPPDAVIDKGDKVADYFPFEQNVHKQYKGTGNEFADFETYVDYVQDDVIQLRNINPGTTSVVVYALKEGVLRKVFQQGEVYYRYDYTTQSNQDEILLQEPIEEGNSWTLQDGSKRTITNVAKEISLPAGKYTALEVTTEKADSIMQEYYVQEMGLVKQEFKAKDESYIVKSELEKIEKQAAGQDVIRIYFPDFNADSVVYVDHEVEFKTNDLMKERIVRLLQKPSSSGDVTPALGENVQIQAISRNSEKNEVTVDFSSNLVREMNAGTSLEVLILESLTNTFANYYQAEKVIITMNGKPYLSGHIAMGEGEAFTPNFENAKEYTGK